MVNVPYAESPRKKYVNPNEIREGIKLVHKLNSDYEISNILVITPVRKQTAMTTPYCTWHIYSLTINVIFIFPVQESAA